MAAYDPCIFTSVSLTVSSQSLCATAQNCAQVTCPAQQTSNVTASWLSADSVRSSDWSTRGSSPSTQIPVVSARLAAQVEPIHAL